MKKSIRLISFAIVLSMLVSSFSACSDGADGEIDTYDSSSLTVANAPAEDEIESEYFPDVERKNYDSDFYLLMHPDSNTIDHHWVKESNNEIMSDAVYLRQQRIRDYLGVEIYGSATERTNQYVEPFRTAVKNKDGSIDACLSHVYFGLDGFISGGYLADLGSYSQLNLDADYWNLGFMEDLAIDGHMYLGKSDFNILWTFVITFNKEMYDKYADAIGESLYSMVDSYTWTFDKLIGISNLVYVDQYSDGHTIDDTFGIVGCQDIAFCGMLHAANINIVTENEQGEYTVSVYNEVNKAKTSDLIDKIKGLAKSDSAWFWRYGGSQIVKFEDGRALFAFSNTCEQLTGYTDNGVSFGVLPYPMYDEGQRDVGYRSLQWGGFLCIPSYVRDPDMVGDTVEMLSFFSEDVNNAYYDRVLGKQSADSPDDRRMLTIVWDGICSEFIQAYYNVALETRILYMIPDLTDKSSGTSLASFMATWTNTVNRKVSKFLYAVRKKH